MRDEGRLFRVELEAADQAVAEHRRLSERLGVAGSALDAARDEQERATAAVGAETAGVRRLERPSTALVRAILRGDRAEQLAARRSALRAAEARVAAARVVVDDREREIATLRAGLRGLGDVDAWYAAALSATETWAFQVGADGVAELRRLAERAQELRREEAGLREVADAVDLAGETLSAALDHLDAAMGLALDERRARRSWLSRSPVIVSDWQKADGLSQAVGLIRKAGASLRVVGRVLDGLGREDVERLVGDDFVGTLDFLFDHSLNSPVFVDRLDSAADRVDEALGLVGQAHQVVGTQMTELRARLADVDERRERLLRSL